MKLTQHDYEVIADVLDAHYEELLDDDTDYFKQLEYLEELIDKVVHVIQSPQ